MLRTLSKGDVFDIPFSGATFTCRAMSGREIGRLESLNGSDSRDNVVRLFSALKKGVRGWSGVLVDDEQSIEELQAAGAELKPTATEGTYEVGFKADLLDIILDVSDAGELLGLVAKGNRPNGVELGKSVSPAPLPPA